MKWVNRSIETLDRCGFIRPSVFEPPEGASAEDRMRALLEWGRVDYTRVKLVNLYPPKRDFVHDMNIDPRIVYIADSGNHCVRRIKVKLRNVDTFAGLCGEPGFKDGLFGLNRLDTPEMVGVDHNGTVFIYDSKNYYIRIVDPATKFMRTLMHGGCRLDYNSHEPMIRIPFQLQLRGMVCFKRWVKTYGDPADHLVRIPKTFEILEPEAVITGYDDETVPVVEEEAPAEAEGGEGGDGEGGDGEGADGEGGEGDGEEGEGGEETDVTEDEL